MDIVEGFLKGDRLSLAKAISTVERDFDSDIISKIAEKSPHSLLDTSVHIIGFTGPPGVGKSTLIGKVLEKLENSGAILCDPTSVKPQGGALLGDRIRIEKTDSFIRSVGTRGERGGISIHTSDIINLYILFGFKNIIVETAGTGQTETDIANLVDTVVVVISPESGDEIQYMKSGIMEIADIVVLNKADRPDSAKALLQLQSAFDLAQTISPTDWKTPIVKTVAKDGKGIEELVSKIQEHKKFLDSKGITEKKRKERLANDFKRILRRKVSEIILKHPKVLDEIEKIKEGKSNPYVSANKLADEFEKILEIK